MYCKPLFGAILCRPKFLTLQSRVSPSWLLVAVAAVVAVQSLTASACATVTLEQVAICRRMKDKLQLALAKAYVDMWRLVDPVAQSN
jgi:hypothetical protein